MCVQLDCCLYGDRQPIRKMCYSHVTSHSQSGNVVWTVPKSGNIITYSSESRTQRHVRTNKKATLQSRDYPAIEAPASKSGIWSHDLKVENTITYGSESRAQACENQ